MGIRECPPRILGTLQTPVFPVIHLSGSRFPWILTSAGLQLFSQLGYNFFSVDQLSYNFFSQLGYSFFSVDQLGYNFFLSWVTGTLQTSVFPLIPLSGSRFPWILTSAGLQLFAQLGYNFLLSKPD